jgi:hypothetical protein
LPIVKREIALSRKKIKKREITSFIMAFSLAPLMYALRSDQEKEKSQLSASGSFTKELKKYY